MTKKKITKDMNIKEVIQKYPETANVFAKYNMGCIGCMAASFEKIEDIVAIHGTDVESFLKELNDAIKEE